MRQLTAVLCVTLASLIVLIDAGARSDRPAAQSAIVFGSDGMRPDLVERFARAGALPVMADLMRRGVRGRNGLIPALPPNTGVGWTTLATGAWTGSHGSTNNTFHDPARTDFAGSTSGFAAGVVLADTLGEAAERAGKRVVFMEWPASRFFSRPPRTLKGPAVDFRDFFSVRGVLSTFEPPDLDRDAVGPGTNPSFTNVTLVGAEGWTNVPESERKAFETTLLIRTTFAAKNPDRRYFLYLYDGTRDAEENYDRVIVATAKDGRTAVAELTPGPFVEVKVNLTITMTDPRRAAGFYLKVIDMTPDLSKFRLYFTSVSRVNSNFRDLNMPEQEEILAARFPTAIAADFSPLQTRMVDEETYVEQGLLWERSHFPILEYLVDTFRPDLLFVGIPLTDEFQHQFLALVTRGAAVFDDANRDGVPDGRVREREGFIRRAYQAADKTLRLAMTLMPPDPSIFVSSDHGFAPTWKAINSSLVLQQAGLIDRPQPGNCRPASANERVKACWVGGSVQIYVNLKGRDSPGVVDPVDYEAVRRRIVKVFDGLRDGRTRVIDRIFLKETLERIRIGGRIQTASHPLRTGDVVVLARPPYQFDAFAPGMLVADAPFFGQHGFWPDLVDLRRNINLHSAFIMAGPGIRSGVALRRVAMVDVAPTVAAVLGIDPPLNSQGRVLRRGLLNAP